MQAPAARHDSSVTLQRGGGSEDVGNCPGWGWVVFNTAVFLGEKVQLVYAGVPTALEEHLVANGYEISCRTTTH